MSLKILQTMTMTNDSAMIVKCHQKMAKTMTMTMTNDTEMIVKCHQRNHRP
jgi:hypothetical protein